MKLNATTYIFGDKVSLIPYKKIHVPKYHQWMQRPDLQELTASEPLTLEEEYQMQQTWLLDENKCTYIIMDNDKMHAERDEVSAMVGDINLYLKDVDGLKVAEVGIMIAEDSSRGRGKGFEALMHMFKYGIDLLKVDKFEAKIGLTNSSSIKLFEKIGFKLVNRSEVFKEATYAILVTEEWAEWLTKITEDSTILF